MKRGGLAAGCLAILLLGARLPASGGPAPLTVAEARALAARAASAQSDVLAEVIEFGAKGILGELAEAGESVPLTLVVLGSPIGPHLQEEDFDRGRATRAELARAMGLGAVERPSVLRERHVTDLAFDKREEAAAEGVIRFEAPDVYKGRVRFAAGRAGGAWRITSFHFPESDVRVAFEEGRWRLITAEAVAAARAPIALPEVTRLGRLPPPESTVAIRLTRDGVLTVGDGTEALGVEGLRKKLRALRKERGARWVDADGSSKLNAVFDVDASVPWNFVQWLMEACVDSEVKIHRFFFRAVLAGSEEPGAIGALLALDRGIEPIPVPRPRPPKHEIVLFKNENGRTTDLRAVWAALHRVPAKDRAEIRFEMGTLATQAVPTGYAVAVIDLLHRAGVRKPVFDGSSLPEGRGPWLYPDGYATEVRSERDRKGSLYARLDKELLGASSPHMPLPSSERVDELVFFDARDLGR